MKCYRPLFTTTEIRAIEQQFADEPLMQRAGIAISRFVQDILPDVRSAILILAGPGNNGGDALVAARLLRDIYPVSVVFCGDTDRLPPDAAAALRDWQKAGGTLLPALPEGKWELVIDGLFGIGLQRPLEGWAAELVAAVNRLGVPVLSIDVPSGLCADTGRVLGCAVRADWTLTFIGLKPGLFTLDGPDHVGEVRLDALETAPASAGRGHLLEQESVSKLLPRRRRNSNKGDFGNLGIIGGAARMTGAAVLAARAGLLSGAGRVYLGLLDRDAPTLDAVMPELMLRPPQEVLALKLDCLVLGPGMGTDDAAARLLGQALDSQLPLLLDADALTMLASDQQLRDAARRRQAPTLLTPHPGEAARLLGRSAADVQQDRIASALKMATDFDAVTLLKGCGSIIALPDGSWFINHSGNPGLASAGMGDTLAGIMGALIAQGLSAEDAMQLATYLHGAAADGLIERGNGPVGLSASEVMTEARWLLNQWVYL
ncbi:MAG TPA: NAD(P)H-hydrate dehydratase [Methylophilaceae bacterium]